MKDVKEYLKSVLETAEHVYDEDVIYEDWNPITRTRTVIYKRQEQPTTRTTYKNLDIGKLIALAYEQGVRLNSEPFGRDYTEDWVSKKAKPEGEE